MIRNPNAASPRTPRDCTFCDWADPIERPAPRYRTWPYGLLVVVAAAHIVYVNI